MFIICIIFHLVVEHNFLRLTLIVRHLGCFHFQFSDIVFTFASLIPGEKSLQGNNSLSQDECASLLGKHSYSLVHIG